MNTEGRDGTEDGRTPGPPGRPKRGRGFRTGRWRVLHLASAWVETYARQQMRRAWAERHGGISGGRPLKKRQTAAGPAGWTKPVMRTVPVRSTARESEEAMDAAQHTTAATAGGRTEAEKEGPRSAVPGIRTTQDPRPAGAEPGPVREEQDAADEELRAVLRAHEVILNASLRVGG